jgi:membrane fusion protein, multidrug efflux system
MSNKYTNALFLRARQISTPAVAVVVLLLGACHRQPPPPPPPAVVVALPVHRLGGGDAAANLHYPVEVAARYTTVMGFRVAGQVVERRVRLGDVVHPGEVVARLDPADAEKQLAAARAALDAAEHRLVFARQTLDRDHAQQAQNLIAANQLEQSENDYAAALAAREQANNQWAVAGNALRYNSLVADHDGVITSENADTGQVLAAGQAVYGLAWSGDVDVTLDAAAADLAKIAHGQSAVVSFPALPGRHFTGRVREIAPAADPQSRTYRVKLTLVDGGAEVRLGMTGDAALVSAVPTAAQGDAPTFVIPATAIFHRGKDPAVWIIRAHDATLELRPVTLSSYAERSATVSGGLAEGETVVLAGVHTVYEGERVVPVKPLFTDDDRPSAAVLASAP